MKSGRGKRTPRPDSLRYATSETVPFIRFLERVAILAGKYADRITPKGYWDYLADTPGDLMGSALYYFDVGVPPHRNTRDVTAMPWGDMGFYQIFGPQKRWLQLVQDATDAGKTWGEAVHSANMRFPLMVKVTADA